MLVVLDFGSTLNKALVYDEGQFNFYKFSLSYVPQVFSAKNVTESFRRLEKIAGRKLLGEKEKPLGDFYLTYGLPLPSELSNLSSVKRVFTTGEALQAWEKPVLEIGTQFIYFGQRLGVASFKTDDVLRWLPFRITQSEVQNYLDNKKIYSNLQPIFPRDLYLEMAISREKIMQLMETQEAVLPAQSLVLSGGVFCACPFVYQSLRLFLDCFQKINSPVEIFLDTRNTLPCLSVLKIADPEIFERVPVDLKPLFLSSVFHFPGGGALNIDLGLREPLVVNIDPESIFVFPLGEGEESQISFKRDKKPAEFFKVVAGQFGFVVDSREHPLKLPEDSAKRVALLKSWEEQLKGAGKSLNSKL